MGEIQGSVEEVPNPWTSHMEASATSYYGLNHATQLMIDGVIKGDLESKTPKEAMELLEMMALQIH